MRGYTPRMRSIRFTIALLGLLGGGVAAAMALQQPCPSTPATTASVEGVVVKLGTAEPIAGVDVELIRVEGTRCAALAAGAAESYSKMVAQGGNGSRDVPAALAREARYTKTLDGGRFAFRNLPEGTFRLVAERGGGEYSPAAYGQRDPRGEGLAFPLSEGQALQGANIAMAASAAISGRVFDADNEPVSHALVLALEPQFKNGRRTLNIAQAVESNERGEFRLFWLTPGRYYVAAKFVDTRRRSLALWIVPPGRTGQNERGDVPVVTKRTLSTGETVEGTYALVYYGGALNPDDARPLDLLSGTTFPGADIGIGAGQVRAWHIRGTALDATGQPLSNRQVRAVPVVPGPANAILNSTTAADGTFDFAGAVTGRYAVFSPAGGAGTSQSGEILTGVPSGSRSMAYAEVDVGNADADRVRIVQRATTNAAASRVTIEGRPVGTADADLAKLRVTLVRVPDALGMPIAGFEGPAARGNSTPNNTGVFRMADPGPGDFRVVVSGLPAGGYVKSIRMGAIDVLNAGLHLTSEPNDSVEIVIGTDGSTLSGTALNNLRQPMSNVVVAVVPDLQQLRSRVDLYRSTTTDANGNFEVSIAPGDYKVFAWEYVPNDAWTNAEFMRPYESLGTGVRVPPGGRHETQLSVIGTAR